MDSSRWSDRARAEEEIAAHEQHSLKRIEQSLCAKDLGLEQRQRLSNLGQQLFESSPRAALGIQWNTATFGEGAVIIGGTVEGFDAARVLKPGDRLLKISGTEIFGRDVARSAIMSHDPGDIAVVQILRRGETETIEVRMGSFDQLERGRREQPDREIIRRAWAIRLARVSDWASTAEVETGMNEDDWIAIELDQNRVLEETATRLAKSGGGVSPRPKGTEGRAPLHTSRSGVTMSATSKFEALEIDPTMEAQAANIHREIERLNRSLMQLRETAKRPDLDANKRRGVAASIAATEEQIIKLKASIPFNP
ncbi:MAG: PDZ domain-containing protein [bacterium]|nr:PDZ domain-containing protein [bacterium]